MRATRVVPSGQVGADLGLRPGIFMGSSLPSSYVNTWLNRRATAAFDPLTAITWKRASWAEDPLWTPPSAGGAVSSWRDASAANDPLLQGNGPNQPVYNPAVVNGLPGITFAGGKWLLNSAHTLGTTYSLVAIFQRTGTTLGTNQNLMARNNAASIYNPSGTPGKIGGLYAGSNLNSGTNVDTSPHMVIGIVTPGTTDVLWCDGTETTGNAGNGGTASLATVIGGFNSTTGDFVGSIALACEYDGDLRSDAQFAGLKAWATRYGMTIV